ncbi:MAG: hypothetical protein GXX96_34225 [Planctomycetaceae bacterium]|nr:hypothetical protein [Planctomycetaceae bacterium]
MRKLILSAAVCGVLVLSGAEGTSRDYQMRQRALVENAMAFFLKGAAMQYDSAPLTVAGMQKNGVGLRQQYFEAPEDATKDRTRYSVCTTYAHEIYYQAFGWKLGGGVPGCFTATLEKNLPAELIVFRQDNLACPDGKIAAAAQARALLEPGDLLVDFVPEHWGHAMFYAGDTDGDGRDEVLHSSGRKYDMATGHDAVEIGGNIYKDDAESLFFTAGNGSLHDLTRVNRYFIVRPLRLAAEDWPLTPSSETRLRYPRLRIDRTVSGGHEPDRHPQAALLEHAYRCLRSAVILPAWNVHAEELHPIAVGEDLLDGHFLGRNASGQNTDPDVTVFGDSVLNKTWQRILGHARAPGGRGRGLAVAKATDSSAFADRNRRTIGDEQATPALTRRHVRRDSSTAAARRGVRSTRLHLRHARLPRQGR